MAKLKYKKYQPKNVTLPSFSYDRDYFECFIHYDSKVNFHYVRSIHPGIHFYQLPLIGRNKITLLVWVASDFPSILHLGGKGTYQITKAIKSEGLLSPNGGVSSTVVSRLGVGGNRLRRGRGRGGISHQTNMYKRLSLMW